MNYQPCRHPTLNTRTHRSDPTASTGPKQGWELQHLIWLSGCYSPHTSMLLLLWQW